MHKKYKNNFIATLRHHIHGKTKHSLYKRRGRVAAQCRANCFEPTIQGAVHGNDM